MDSASNPSSEEESEIDMNETRRRMHAMLDDAFSLLGPQSAKKPEKIPEGNPSHPAPHPTQVYSSTPARPAVIPRWVVLMESQLSRFDFYSASLSENLICAAVVKKL